MQQETVENPSKSITFTPSQMNYEISKGDVVTLKKDACTMYMVEEVNHDGTIKIRKTLNEDRSLTVVKIKEVTLKYPSLAIVFSTDHTTGECFGMQNGYLTPLNRQFPDSIHNSVIAFCVTHKENWTNIEQGCKPFFSQLETIILENQTILLNIPAANKTNTNQNIPISKLKESEYFQEPQKKCPQCFHDIDDLKLHLAEHHTKSNFFCSLHNTPFYFKNKFQKQQHDRTFHILCKKKRKRFDHKVEDVFPRLTKKAEDLGISKSDKGLKRKVSHLSYANFKNKKIKHGI